MYSRTAAVPAVLQLYQYYNTGTIVLESDTAVPVQLDMYARPVPNAACGMIHLNLETVYALVVLFIYWEDNILKALLKVNNKY